MKDQAEALGDVVIELALRCAILSDRALDNKALSKSFAQRSIIWLGYLANGARTDESRLSWLTRGLCTCSWYPAGVARHAWPNDMADLALSNSLLITYRALVYASEHPFCSSRPPLWSAATRGLRLARATLRQAHTLLPSMTSSNAATGLRLVQAMVTKYAQILVQMATAAAVLPGSAMEVSGWAAFFTPTSEGPAFLTKELSWIGSFLEATSGPDYGMHTFEEYLRRGVPFLFEDSETPPN